MDHVLETSATGAFAAGEMANARHPSYERRTRVEHWASALDQGHRSDGTGGGDGFISFECAPDVADDAEATLAQALDLSQRLDLPNVLIEVPATEAGVSAIEEPTAPGSTSTCVW